MTLSPCTEDPDLWFSADLADRAEAIHMCLRHCGALRECRRWAKESPPISAVQAGTSYSQTGVPERNQPDMVGVCATCCVLPAAS